MCPESQRLPFEGDPDRVFGPDWSPADLRGRLAAVRLEVLPMPDDVDDALAQLSEWLDPQTTVAVTVIDDQAILAGDFQPDDHGYTRFVLFVPATVGRRRIGRTVQRVLDLETYRSLAMLGFLHAQALSRELSAIDARVLDLVDHLEDTDRPADEVLHDLLAVTAELETLATTHDSRFGATSAYAAIVEDRLTALGEGRLRGRLTLREFLARRYQPTVRTVHSTEDRLHRLIARAGRAADLLRTKVDVARAAQNQALLRTMNERAELQLRLQHTVEGLSVVAITYYALGLLGYLLAPWAHEAGLDKTWLMAALTPIVLLVAWWGMRAVRGRLHESADPATSERSIT